MIRISGPFARVPYLQVGAASLLPQPHACTTLALLLLLIHASPMIFPQSMMSPHLRLALLTACTPAALPLSVVYHSIFLLRHFQLLQTEPTHTRMSYSCLPGTACLHNLHRSHRTLLSYCHSSPTASLGRGTM